jgi:hypothetical protein
MGPRHRSLAAWSGRADRRSLGGAAALAGVLILALAPIASAAPPAPSAGSATVDGDTSDWSLAADQFADLTHGGVAGRTVVGHLYLRYDCDSETLYGLVLLIDGNKALVSRPENAYLRIDGSGKLVSGESGNDGTPPDFAWVDSDGEFATGYEASGSLAPGSYTIRSHVLIPDDSVDGYASIDNVSRATPLVTECVEPTPTPTATPSATPEPTATPTPSGSVEPTATPSATPEPTATPTPSGSVEPTATPDPTATPSGSVEAATGTPGITLPPTDAIDPAPPAGGAQTGTWLTLGSLLAVSGALLWILPARTRKRLTDEVDATE